METSLKRVVILYISTKNYTEIKEPDDSWQNVEFDAFVRETFLKFQ